MISMLGSGFWVLGSGFWFLVLGSASQSLVHRTQNQNEEPRTRNQDPRFCLAGAFGVGGKVRTTPTQVTAFDRTAAVAPLSPKTLAALAPDRFPPSCCYRRSSSSDDRRSRPTTTAIPSSWDCRSWQKQSRRCSSCRPGLAPLG